MTDTAVATNPFAKSTKTKAKDDKQAKAEFPTEPVNAGTAADNGMSDSTPTINVGNPTPLPPEPGQGQGAGLPTPGATPQGQAEPSDGPPDPAQFNPYGGTGAGDLPDDFVIDLSDVQSGGRDFIGIGRHLLVCSKVTSGISQAGNSKLVFSFNVASGDYEGKRVDSHLAITDPAKWKIDEVLRAMAMITDDSPKKPTFGELKQKAVGRLVIGEFVKDTYNNQPTSSLNRIYPPDEVGIRAGTTMDMARRGEGFV